MSLFRDSTIISEWYSKEIHFEVNAVLERLTGGWPKVEFWVGGHFYVLFFLYIKSSCSLLFVAFLMEKGNKKLIKKRRRWRKLPNAKRFSFHTKPISLTFIIFFKKAPQLLQWVPMSLLKEPNLYVYFAIQKRCNFTTLEDVFLYQVVQLPWHALF